VKTLSDEERSAALSRDILSRNSRPRRLDADCWKEWERWYSRFREMPAVQIDHETILAAANLLRRMGASQVFIFGSAVRGELRPDSDIDMAVSGLEPRVYFSAVSKASDLLGRPLDLVDLDDDTPLVRHLLSSGELVRVG